jgi:hypothetical protein
VSAGQERLDGLYDTTLQPRLAALESLRLSLKSYIVKSVALIGVPAAIFVLRGVFGFFLPRTWAGFVGPVSFAGILVGVAIAATKYLLPGLTAQANYTARFKQEVVAEIFNAVCPTAAYAAHQGIAADEFEAAGIFPASGTYASDDLVRGHIGQTPFKAAEVRRTISTGSGKDQKTLVVFHGLFFHVDFNKQLRGVTIVEPEGAPRYQIGSRSGLTLVSLENPDFEREFKVYASSDSEARYVLTPAIMERLLAVRVEAGKPVFLAFRSSGAYLGIHYDRSLFEPSIAETTSKEAVLEMGTHFDLADVIVRELDLNTRIWTKDVDDSLLRRSDKASNGLMELAAARGGHLTERELWTKAKAAVGEDFEKEIGKEIPKPQRTRIRIDHAGGETTVRYGWSVAGFVGVLISLVAAAIVVSALHQLASTTLVGDWGPLLGRIPTYAPLDRLVSDNGIVWLPVAGVIGGLFAFAWMLRVRRVVVQPDVVLVYRGIRPFPRRYPRSEYTDILRLKNSVHLSKGEGVTLFNPTASPNLSEGEAGWVAFELRRALRTAAALVT